LSQKNPCPQSGLSYGQCILLLCGRFHPLSNKILSMVSMDRSTNISSLTPSQENAECAFQEQELMKNLDTISLPKIYCVSNEVTKMHLTKMIPVHEDVSVYIPMFHTLMQNGDLTTEIKCMVHSACHDLKKEDVAIKRLRECGRDFLVSYAQTIIGSIPANVRSRLVKFDVPENGEQPSHTDVFTFRQESDKLERELDCMLGFLVSERSPIIKSFAEQVISPCYGKENELERGLIPKLLYQLATQEMEDLSVLPCLCKYALATFFRQSQKK